MIMSDGIDRIVKKIEDSALLDMGLRIILDAVETKELPKESSLPIFNDILTNEMFVSILEKVTGKTY